MSIRGIILPTQFCGTSTQLLPSTHSELAIPNRKSYNMSGSRDNLICYVIVV
ncbi:hypothetical protein J7M23_06395 [Candidatus Sumerlaeota bacterium]|nr:hypothetical protein [Candidatus Sumerlaeota bacterium]